MEVLGQLLSHPLAASEQHAAGLACREGARARAKGRGQRAEGRQGQSAGAGRHQRAGISQPAKQRQPAVESPIPAHNHPARQPCSPLASTHSATPAPPAPLTLRHDLVDGGPPPIADVQLRQRHAAVVQQANKLLQHEAHPAAAGTGGKRGKREARVANRSTRSRIYVLLRAVGKKAAAAQCRSC